MIDYALIMLASGSSSRFGDANKLLTPYRGKPLCAQSANLGADLATEKRLAIVPEGSEALASVYANAGWSVVANNSPQLGQSRSIVLGTQAAIDLKVSAVIFCLADMPLIDQAHIDRLCDAARLNESIMSSAGTTLMPPAAFQSSLFEPLLKLTGDRGAKHVFQASHNTHTIELPESMAIDIDTQADLMTLNSAGQRYV